MIYHLNVVSTGDSSSVIHQFEKFDEVWLAEIYKEI